METRFNEVDADRAYAEWGANCGPGALAAVMGMTLDEVRPHLGDFEARRYMSPSMMFAALRAIRRPWEIVGKDWPEHGLVRVQWEGPWLADGVPVPARYKHTHWVAAQRLCGEIGVFDINCIDNGSGWVSLTEWVEVVVPYLTEVHRNATGGWHITHAIEIERRQDR